MDFIKCHGSGNDFILIDTTTSSSLLNVDWSAFARVACDRQAGIGSDGILLVVKHDDAIYGMDMLNPDGTHAEMCGNGIRCVARLAAERGYICSGILRSGGSVYPVKSAEPLADGIATFAVDIPISTSSRDFPFVVNEPFVGRRIESLDDELLFTALNLGNPHIVAAVDSISMDRLKALGERVKVLKEVFPNGVNVSLYECHTSRSIFVATYERGAGITLSCGTAMTASASAAALLGRVDVGERIEVCNRGGRVFCTTRLEPSIITRLEGNATFDWYGRAEFDGKELSFERVKDTMEDALWRSHVESLNR